MWLWPKISQHGIGNGISIIIAVGIIARYPLDIAMALNSIKTQGMSWIGGILVLAATLVMAAVIIFSQQASRKIPVQHARRMVGRKMMQGGNTFIPLKLNTANVIPVIFASAILTLPRHDRSLHRRGLRCSRGGPGARDQRVDRDLLAAQPVRLL